MRVLVVEDELYMAEAIRDGLRLELRDGGCLRLERGSLPRERVECALMFLDPRAIELAAQLKPMVWGGEFA